tara:strand:+ start:141 stop:389 length:249 start_codon:yes stop_codon:yes gene_type:complete
MTQPQAEYPPSPEFKKGDKVQTFSDGGMWSHPSAYRRLTGVVLERYWDSIDEAWAYKVYWVPAGVHKHKPHYKENEIFREQT